jgi:serine/threonine protein kinase
MITALLHLDELSPGDRRLLSDHLEAFRESWDGSRLARALSQLPPMTARLRSRLLTALVGEDLRRRWALGQKILIEQYLPLHPDLGTAETVSVALVAAEHEARCRAEGHANLDDLACRFPRQTARLQELLGQTRDDGVAETCPAPLPRAASAGSAEAASSSPVRVGKDFGRYQILKELGKGGMGTVYLAEDTQLRRRVALKIPHAGNDPALLSHFLREARAAAAIDHPNICPIHDVGEHHGVRYLTMSYIEGMSLQAVLRGGPMGQRESAVLVRKLALALAETHARGILHRDLKPSNILINRRGEPIITDFGLARHVEGSDSHRTPVGALVGTPAYMAPEQVEGPRESLGPACDVYALGVILYEMLTGRPPFQGPVTRVLARVLTEEPPSLRQARPDVAAGLEAICVKALAKSPDARFPSMQALAAALGDYLQSPESSAEPGSQDVSEAITVRREGQPKPPVRRRRGLVVAVSIAASVLLLALVGVLAFIGLRSPSPPVPPASLAVPPEAKPLVKPKPKPPDEPKPVVVKDPFPDWQDFAPKEARFRIRMPGQPKRSEQKVALKKGQESKIVRYEITYGQVHLGATYSDLAGRVFAPEEIEKAYDHAQEGLLQSVKATLIDSRKVKIGCRPAREVWAEANLGKTKVRLRVRLLVVRTRLYQMLVLAAPEEVNRPEVDYFLQSLVVK